MVFKKASDNGYCCVSLMLNNALTSLSAVSEKNIACYCDAMTNVLLLCYAG